MASGEGGSVTDADRWRIVRLLQWAIAGRRLDDRTRGAIADALEAHETGRPFADPHTPDELLAAEWTFGRRR